MSSHRTHHVLVVMGCFAAAILAFLGAEHMTVIVGTANNIFWLAEDW